MANSFPGTAEPPSSDRSSLLAPVFSLLSLQERLCQSRVTGAGRDGPAAPSPASADASAVSWRVRRAATALTTLVPISSGTYAAVGEACDEIIKGHTKGHGLCDRYLILRSRRDDSCTQ